MIQDHDGSQAEAQQWNEAGEALSHAAGQVTCGHTTPYHACSTTIAKLFYIETQRSLAVSPRSDK